MDVILPFLLIFAVVFAVADKVKLLGDNKRTHVIIALVMALAVIIPHVTYSYPPDADVVNIINSALPQIAVVIVAVVMVLILAGMFTRGEFLTEGVSGFVALMAFLIVAYIFARAANWIPGYKLLYWLDDPAVQSILIILLIFGLAIWLITYEAPKGEGESAWKNFFKIFKKP